MIAIDTISPAETLMTWSPEIKIMEILYSVENLSMAMGSGSFLMWSHSLVIVSFMYGKYFYERFEKVMFEIIQEAALPKLSQTDLYSKYDASSQLTACVKTELVNASQYTVKPSDIQELIALMKLNGDGFLHNAIDRKSVV